MNTMQREIVFDADASADARDEGIARASSQAYRRLLLLDARRMAIMLAMRNGETNADEVVRWYAEHDIDLTGSIGNAMGALFRGDEWEWTGKFINSARVHAHANLLRVWRLANGRGEGGS